MRKETFLKLLVTVLLIASSILALVISNKINKDRATSKEIGSITIEVIDFEGEKRENTFSFKEGDSVWSIVRDNYTVKYTDTQFGVMITELDNIKTDFTITYIAIYVDGKYSNYTISNIPIKDKMVISLRASYL